MYMAYATLEEEETKEAPEYIGFPGWVKEKNEQTKLKIKMRDQKYQEGKLKKVFDFQAEK